MYISEPTPPKTVYFDTSPVTGENVRYITYYLLKPSVLGYSAYAGSVKVKDTDPKPDSSTNVVPITTELVLKGYPYTSYYRDGAWTSNVDLEKATFEQLVSRLTAVITRKANKAATKDPDQAPKWQQYERDNLAAIALLKDKDAFLKGLTQEWFDLLFML